MSETALDRVRQTGLKSVDAIALLAIVLATDESDSLLSEERARTMLRGRGLYWLGDLSRADYLEASDLDDFCVLRNQCAVELGRRVGMAATNQKREVINGPEDAVEYFIDIAEKEQEHFCALYLDAKGGVISRRTIHIGTLTMSLVGIREVFREAVRESACSIIVAHNHPSGDPSPSAEDIDVTKRLIEAGKLLDIDLRDHIVIGRGSWRSLRRAGFV